ncbi:MAG: VWA domain-containing protein [Myxococcales bacterium]|nr:VWA domain-containing protein [Myxococcales bacterium]
MVRRAACLAWLLAQGCSDAGLVSVKTGDDRIALEGELCTGPPVDTVRNVRVLFLTDSSNSMRFNDPNDLLVDALQYLTSRYAGQPNIAFAIVRWGSRRTVRENVDYAPAGTDPPYFTNDPAVLAEIFKRMRADPTQNPDKYLDGTDYELALRAATDYLVADLGKNPAQSLTNRYLVEFVTDGIPQSATNDPWETRRAIVAAVANLHQRYGARVDITSIALSMVLPPEFVGLLPEMARAGGGVYTQLATPQGLDGSFDKALSNPSQLVEYELAGYFALNRNLRMPGSGSSSAPELDSDGDGLVDTEEEALGLDPTSPDSDGDKLSDLFEQLLRPQYDPLAADRGDRGTDGDLDPDADGLTSFEESRLGTDPKSPDTDRDGVPDGVELCFGLEPLEDDAQSDRDGDKVPAIEEVRQNLSPTFAEEPSLRERAAHRTAPALSPVRAADGIRCYEFGVENVLLGLTRPGKDGLGRKTPAGLNVLELIAIERPIAASQATAASAGLLPNRQLRAVRHVILGEGGQRNPQAQKLFLRPNEFAP